MVNNRIIIGDNAKVLKSAVLDDYIGKVKMIYIDPPYNTNTAKSYNDKKTSDEWIQFMKMRLEASKNYLMKEGVIFISIDDNEYANLKLLCDEVFGRANYIGSFITYQSLRSNAKLMNVVHEYVLSYAVDKKLVKDFKIKRIFIPEDKKIIDEVNNRVKNVIDSENLVNDGIKKANKEIKSIIKEISEKYDISWIKNYNNVDENGQVYFAMDLSTPGQPRSVDISSINLHLEPLNTRGWSSDEKFIDLYKKNLLVFKNERPYEKHYLNDAEDNVSSIMRFFSRNGTNDLKKLGLYNLFDTPKPVEMIKFLIRIATESNDIVMDFFAGSGTTAQAVEEVNFESGRHNTFILVQKKEMFNEKSNPYKVCVANNIKPYTSEALKLRIRAFAEKSKYAFNYDIIEDEKFM